MLSLSDGGFWGSLQRRVELRGFDSTGGLMGNANSGRYPKLTSEERRRIIGLVADGMRAVDVAREVRRSASFV